MFSYTAYLNRVNIKIFASCYTYSHHKLVDRSGSKIVFTPMTVQLTGLTQAELSEFVQELGEPAYRGQQLFSAIQRRRVRSYDQITDLPKEFRAKLQARAEISTLKVESRYLSSDGTRRYLMKTHDGRPVETVFIPEERRDTICFSSQSGCPLQCTFCLTAQLGLLRNLTAGEIVEQIIVALNDAYGDGIATPRGTNLVGMGAGEPFLNFEELLKALRIMSDPDGLHIVYGVSPLVVSLFSEGMRVAVAQKELEGVEDVDALERSEQVALAKRVALGEMGVMTVGALLILTLALRAFQTGG